MKVIVILVVTVALVTGLVVLNSRLELQRDIPDEIVPPTGANVAGMDQRPEVRKDGVNSAALVNGAAPAQGQTLSEPKSETADVDGSPPIYGSLEAMSVSEAMTNLVDDSVIGRRLKLSPATMPKCAEGEDGIDCEDWHRIEQFTSEPRDSAWAGPVETILRSTVEKKKSEFSIRNLECRLTTCIIEVESTAGFLGPDLALKIDDWRAVKVKPFRVRVGYERDRLGREIAVTLWIYQRTR